MRDVGAEQRQCCVSRLDDERALGTDDRAGDREPPGSPEETKDLVRSRSEGAQFPDHVLVLLPTTTNRALQSGQASWKGQLSPRATGQTQTQQPLSREHAEEVARPCGCCKHVYGRRV